MMNQTNPLELRATAGRLRTLAAAGQLEQTALERALRLAGHLPGGAAWLAFLNTALLILGAAFTLSGVFFFFAFNWAEMGRFLKFGVIEVALLLCVGLVFSLRLNTLPGKVALSAAALLVGALLAVFGQVYQTGADAYQLFLTWTILITGWVAISAFGPLWLGLLVLLNLTAITYWNQVVNQDSMILYGLLFLINGGALLAWEVAHGAGVSWLRHRWLPRLIAPAAFLVLLIPTLQFIFDVGQNPDFERLLFIAPPLYLGFTAAVLYYYTQPVQDLFMLTLAALGLIVVVTAAVMRLLDFDGDSAFIFLLLSLIVIGQAAVAVRWLMHISNQWEEQYG